MKKLLSLAFLLTISLMVLPNLKADCIIEEDLVLLAETTKYYKTITNSYSNENLLLYSNLIDSNSTTIEISEDEYNNVNLGLLPLASVETTYKKLTSSIYQNGNYYRYKADLYWKNIPSRKSYDIIAIGFNQSVKAVNNRIFFYQNYCQSDGICNTSSTHSPQIFSGGVGTSFKLPDEQITSLNQTLYFDVEKNTSATIISQTAAADYSHATKIISFSDAKRYTVGLSGISLNGTSSYYDSINTANTTWSGNW